MKTVYFTNPGTIDPNAFRVMGMSAKSDSSKIGQFGTGLKYAIAGVLRLGGRIRIMSDEETYNFDISPTTMRDKDFSLITCNGEALAYTTDYGQHWEPWQLFRELHSNALDEEGTSGLNSKYYGKGVERTVIAVDCEEIYEAFLKKEQYSINPKRQPIFASDDVEIYEGKTESVYFKGVKVGFVPDSQYTYNFLSSDIDLTEDRTIKYQFQFNEALGKFIAALTDSKLLSKLVGAGQGLEAMARFDYAEPSEEILDVVRDRLLVNPNAKLQGGLKGLYVKHRGAFERKKLEMTERQKRMVAKVLEFLAQIGYKVEFPIYLVEQKGDSLFGQAKDGEIHLTEKAFEHGVNDLAQTLLEEYAHLETGYGDETRQLQQWLFRQVVYQGEERLQTIL